MSTVLHRFETVPVFGLHQPFCKGQNFISLQNFDFKQQSLYLVCWVEGVIWNETRQKCVINSAEGQAILPTAAEVCDLNILPQKNKCNVDQIQQVNWTSDKLREFLLADLVAMGTTLTPVQQGIPSGASVAPQQSTETILRSGQGEKVMWHSFNYHYHPQAILQFTDDNLIISK